MMKGWFVQKKFSIVTLIRGVHGVRYIFDGAVFEYGVMNKLIKMSDLGYEVIFTRGRQVLILECM